MLRDALAGSQKSVTIEIDGDALNTLKNANYKLCFATKVSEADYNVVWQSYDDYLTNNTFSWTPQYQLFGSNSFQTSVSVHVATNLKPVDLGEQCTLDESGGLGGASSGSDPTAITMINDYGDIHPGLQKVSTGIDGSLVSTPIYVAPDAAVQGTIELTPVDKVLVWFEQNIETSTIFSDARSKSVEIDLTEVNSATRKYTGQGWSTPG